MRLIRPLVLLLLVLVGVGIILHNEMPPLAALWAPNDGVAVEPEVTRYYTETEAVLARGDFAELDREVAELRASSPRFAGGDLKLYHFYNALADLRAASCGCRTLRGAVYDNDTNFEQRLDLVRAWQAAGHDETAPLIVKAILWREYAWKARGTGYDSEMSDDGSKLFDERIAKEAETVQAVDRQKDPMAYTLALSLARDTGWPRDRLDALYNEAVARYPGHFQLYTQHANILKPKWFGEPGELAAYSRALLARASGNDDALVAYSYVAAYMTLEYGSREILEQAGLSWPDVKRSFELRRERFGLSINDWNFYLVLCLAGHDRPAAKEAAEQIGDRWNNAIWSSWKEFYKVSAWARR